MGQKSNPNSFQRLSQPVNHLIGTQHSLEYSNFLRERSSISSNLTAFFEKNNCIVKDCFFMINNEKYFITIYINFLVLKRRKRNFKNPVLILKSDVSLIVQKIFKILTHFGYFSSKRIIFQNLNKLASSYKKNFFFKEYNRVRAELAPFSKEIYFEPGISLFCLLNAVKKSSKLVAKFIARFFRIFHKSKKIRKFLLFLSKFVLNTDNKRFKASRVKGLKIQIKGRLDGVPRSRKRIFEKGRIPLQTIMSTVNYSMIHIYTSYGVFGLKVWIFD